MEQNGLEGNSPQEETKDVVPQKPDQFKIIVLMSREKCISQRTEDIASAWHVDLTKIK